MQRQLIECVPNISEGRDRSKIDAIAAVVETVEGVRLLDVDPGKATNRTVITFVGEPGPADFFLLRTLPTLTPLVSDIPYHLEVPDSAQVARVTASLARGELPEISCFNGSSVESNQFAAAKWLNKARLNFISRMFRSSASPF